MENLMQPLVNMQSQLEEARRRGELDQFIDDHHEELDRLLTKCMWAITAETKSNVA